MWDVLWDSLMTLHDVYDVYDVGMNLAIGRGVVVVGAGAGSHPCRHVRASST